MHARADTRWGARVLQNIFHEFIVYMLLGAVGGLHPSAVTHLSVRLALLLLATSLLLLLLLRRPGVAHITQRSPAMRVGGEAATCRAVPCL